MPAHDQGLITGDQAQAERCLHYESTRDSDEGQDKLLLAMNRHDWVPSWTLCSKGAVSAQAEVRWGARILLQVCQSAE